MPEGRAFDLEVGLRVEEAAKARVSGQLLAEDRLDRATVASSGAQHLGRQHEADARRLR